MGLNRRHFLLSSGALALSGCLPQDKDTNNHSLLISAASDIQGNYYAVAVNLAGKLISKVPLSERGHDALAMPHKPGHAIVIARRPDRYLMEIDFRDGRVIQQTESEPDTHFYGHGRFIEEGRYLLTSENQFDTGEGAIVVRDSQNFQVLQRFASGGIGPHDMGLLPDGKTLVVANGGIQTHPDYHRIKLNLKDMEPNLSYIDIVSGKVLSSYHPEHHQQSIRHLTVRSDGKVFAGVQYQGNKSDVLPLIYAHLGEDTLQPCAAPDEQWLSMEQYTASVLVRDKELLVSCPRGGTLTRWDADSHGFIERINMADVSGLCVVEDELVASTGHGKLYKKPLASADNLLVNGIRFDNHMTVIEA